MWRETNLFGIYLPPLLVYMVSALALYLPVRLLLVRFGVFRWISNTPLAEGAILVCILGALVRWL